MTFDFLETRTSKINDTLRKKIVTLKKSMIDTIIIQTHWIRSSWLHKRHNVNDND